MNELLSFFEGGSAVMFALLALSLLLYYRCLALILALRALRARVSNFLDARGTPSRIGELEAQLEDSYQQSTRPITALIAAAPLLGLLGTVIGMISTFESLSDSSGARSFDGLAAGISQALVTTQTGLAVAIPALILVHFSRRELQRCLLQIASL